MENFSIILVGFFIACAAAQSTTPSTTPPSTTKSGAPSSPPKPEDCAAKIYSQIKGFKGSKDDLFKRLEDQFNVDMKNMKVTAFNQDNWNSVVDLVSKRIARDDPITVDDFKKFADNLINKWRASNKN